MWNWKNEAACRGEDTNRFYPVGRPGSVGYDRQVAQARAVCAGCPVALECLRSALAEGDDWAVRGGTSPADRRALRVRRWWARRDREAA